jgi:hypothetical protein
VKSAHVSHQMTKMAWGRRATGAARSWLLLTIAAMIVFTAHFHIHALLWWPKGSRSSKPEPQQLVIAQNAGGGISTMPAPSLDVPLPLPQSSPPPPPPPPTPPDELPISEASTHGTSTQDTDIAADGMRSPRAMDTANCEATGVSCDACLKIRARKVPADTGVRCVWCRAEGACRGFLKGTAFPCADAVRSGGGYPGGSKCTRAPSTNGGGSSKNSASRGGSRGGRGGGGGGDANSLLQPPPLSLAGGVATAGATASSIAAAPASAIGAVSELQHETVADDGGRHEVEPLWFAAPAKEFREALPLGNGRIGAMVYGAPWSDKYAATRSGTRTLDSRLESTAAAGVLWDSPSYRSLMAPAPFPLSHARFCLPIAVGTQVGP